MSDKYGSFANSGNPINHPQLNITAKDLKTLQCEKCNGEIFAEGLIIKTVSPILTGGKEGMLPIPAFYCVKCQTVVNKYLPDEMKQSSVLSH